MIGTPSERAVAFAEHMVDKDYLETIFGPQESMGRIPLIRGIQDLVGIDDIPDPGFSAINGAVDHLTEEGFLYRNSDGQYNLM